MEYRCNICNKKYSSYQSLWIHNKKFHNNSITNNHEKYKKHNEKITKNHELQIVDDSISYNKLQCKYCNKLFKHNQNKWDHEKNYCKNKINVNKPITKKQINKQINNNINNGIINNNNQINNIIINQIGKETLDGLTLNDILSITKDGNNMPITCIKKVNFNKRFPENHSFCTTTLEGKHFTRINHKTQKPEKINKVDFINEVLDSSLRFINNISLMIEFDELFRDNIPPEHQHKIKDIIDNQNKFHEAKNKKAFFNCINDLSYNFKDIIIETWKLIQPLDNKHNYFESDSEEPPLIDENFNYISSDDEI